MMDNKFSKRTPQGKIVNICAWILQIAVFLLFSYLLFLRFKNGQHIAMPVVGCILLVIIGIYRVISSHKRFQENDEEKKKFNQIVTRSIIIAPILVAIVLGIVVFLKVKFG